MGLGLWERDTYGPSMLILARDLSAHFAWAPIAFDGQDLCGTVSLDHVRFTFVSGRLLSVADSELHSSVHTRAGYRIVVSPIHLSPAAYHKTTDSICELETFCKVQDGNIFQTGR